MTEPSFLAVPKAEARRAAFARRRAAHPEWGATPEAATEALVAAVLATATTGAIVSGYLPIRTEIDPRPAMIRLHEAGLRICAPVVIGPGLPLRFREWTPEGALEVGPFGALAPASGDWLTPDLVIAPLVAFDDARMRLGYGGGFYDRTLAMLAEGAGAPVPTLGFAYAAQRSDTPLPAETTDRPLDRIITENG